VYKELVAAQSGQERARPDRGSEPGADQAEEVVADVVTEGVVDLLELVEVDQPAGPGVSSTPEGRSLPSEFKRWRRAWPSGAPPPDPPKAKVTVGDVAEPRSSSRTVRVKCLTERNRLPIARSWVPCRQR